MPLPNLYEALKFMLSQDGDHANLQNAIGFNKQDTGYAHSLGEQLEHYGALSKKQVVTLRRILKKYNRNQLKDQFDLNAEVPIRRGSNLLDSGSGTQKGTGPSRGTKGTVSSEDPVVEIVKGTTKKDRVVLLLVSEYDKDLVEAIKTVPKRYWNKTLKRWEFPYTGTSLSNLSSAIEKFKPDVDKAVLKELGESSVVVTKKKKASRASKIKGQRLKIQGLGGTLRRFQEAGVHFMELAEGRVLLADEMGLGKTVQTLAYMQKLGKQKLRRCLVVCPAVIKGQWAEEAKIWLSEGWAVTVIYGSDPLPDVGIVIINYDLIWRRREEIIAWSPDLVVLDECHFVKNPKAQRTKGVIGWNEKYIDDNRKQKWAKFFGVASQAKRVLALSGTPFLNRVEEMFTTLILLDPETWGKSVFRLKKRYLESSYNGFGWTFGDMKSDRLEEFKVRLSGTMLRREKIDVLKELPPKTRVVLPVEITNMANYRSAEKDIIRWIEENGGLEAAMKARRAEYLVKLSKLRALVGKGKVVAACQWAENFLSSTDKKLVIFATHKDVVTGVARKLDDLGYQYRKIDGSVKGKARDKARRDFQDDPKVRAMIISKAGGVGLNLHAASDMLFIERLWNPPQEEQVEDRIHRMGQRDRVTVWQLSGIDTVDDYFAGLVKDKRAEFAKAIRDGKKDSVKEVALSEGDALKALGSYLASKGVR